MGCDTMRLRSTLILNMNLKQRLKEAQSKLRFRSSRKFLFPKLQELLKESGVTPATAKKIVTGKRPKKYLARDITASAIIRGLSPKCFRLIRSRRWMQLPSDTTVRAWLRKFSIREGLQPKLMEVVKVKHPEPEAREVFLSFDEMSLKERWVYDKVCQSRDAGVYFIHLIISTTC